MTVDGIKSNKLTRADNPTDVAGAFPAPIAVERVTSFPRSAGSPAPKAYRFDAFMSYSHESDDARGVALECALEKLAKPWHKRRALNVFRDRTSLSASPHLWGSIEAALRESAHLILLASPAASRSSWVNREISYWRQTRSIDSLLLVLTEGELTWDSRLRDFSDASTALPDALRGAFVGEPLWVDLRSVTDEEMSLKNSRYRSAVAEVAAALRGVSKDDLEADDLRQHRRSLRLARAAVAVLATLAILAATAAVVAVRARGEALKQRDLARAGAASALAGQAQLLESADPPLALAVSAEAYQRHENPDTTFALRQAYGAFVDNGIARTLDAHTGGAASVAFSPDGQSIASAGADGTVKVWDANSGRLLRTLSGHAGPVAAIAYDSDGTTLASGGADAAIRLWDPETGHLRKTFKGHGDPITAVAFSPDGHTLASASYDRTVRFWDTTTGQETRRLDIGDDFPWDVAFSSDGSLLATSSNNGEVTLWEVESGQTLRTVRGHGDTVKGVVFSPDDAVIASAGDDRTVKLWDTDPTNVDEIATLSGHGAPVVKATFSPDGLTLASASEDRTIKIWDVSDSSDVRETRALVGHIGPVTSIDFSPDGSTIVSGSEDGAVKIWDLNRGRHPLHRLSMDLGVGGGIAVASDGSVATGSDGNDLTSLWGADGRLLATLEGTSAISPVGYGVTAVAFSADDKSLASGTAGGDIELWDITTLTERRKLHGHTDAVTAVTFSPDGQSLVSSGRDGTIRLWDLRSGRLLNTLGDHTNAVNSVAYSPDGALLASGSADGNIVLWDGQSGRQLRTIAGHHSEVRSVAFSPDGRRLASGGIDGSVRLWEPRSGQRVMTLTRPGGEAAETDGVTALAFGPDGSILATASDYRVTLWELGSGRVLRTISNEAPITALAFDASGSVLAVAGFPVDLWEIHWASAAEACELARTSVSTERLRAALSGAEPRTCDGR